MKMKKMKTILLLSLIFMGFGASAQTEEIKIKTSAICDMCKDNIENALAFEKGIKKSELDVESKIVTVTYNAAKTNPEKIRIAISKIGYDADDVSANEKAYKKLDACCKKGAVCNDK